MMCGWMSITLDMDRPPDEKGLGELVRLVRRFRSSNHIDIINKPHPEEPTEGRRLEGCPQATAGEAAILRAARKSALLRMRSVCLSSMRSIRLVSWNRSSKAFRDPQRPLQASSASGSDFVAGHRSASPRLT